MKNFSRVSQRPCKSRNEELFRFQGRRPDIRFRRLPQLSGRQIHVSFKPSLTAHRGKLLSKAMKGDAVYAGSFLRKRRIVMDDDMLRTPRILERIFVHEVFHFVWLRLGPRVRASYELLVSAELDRAARGELGWSSESLKLKVTDSDRVERSRRWRDYICESFCDTAGWLFGSTRHYSEMTLARRYRDARRRWFEETLSARPLSI
jgi:hypothetical protein